MLSPRPGQQKSGVGWCSPEKVPPHTKLPSCHAGHCHPPPLTAPSRATARAPIVTLCHGLSAQAEMTEMWGEKAVEGTSSQLLPYCTAAVREPHSGTGSGCSGGIRACQVGTITFPAACGCTGGCLCHCDCVCNPASPWSECIHAPTDRRFPSGTHRESLLSPPWAAPTAPGSPPAPAGSPPWLSRATRGPGTRGRASHLPAQGPELLRSSVPCQHRHATAVSSSAPSSPDPLPATRAVPSALPLGGADQGSASGDCPRPWPGAPAPRAPEPPALAPPRPRGPRAGPTVTGRSGSRSLRIHSGPGGVAAGVTEGRGNGCGLRGAAVSGQTWV